MAEKQKKKQPEPDVEQTDVEQAPQEQAPVEQAPQEPDVSQAGAAEPEQVPPAEEDRSAKLLAEAEDRFLRLAAEYDNYRKRTAKEKDGIWNEATAKAVRAFLPVYDNLERALRQETADGAYAKGVELTMKGLQDALAGLGVETVPALGETFDPKFHNAVMHVEDPNAGENTVVEVYQQGFLCGEKLIREATVVVAN